MTRSPRKYDTAGSTRRAAATRAATAPELDAALLVLPLLGIDAPDSPRVRGTIDAITRDLDAGGPLIYRYPPGRDGLPGTEGAFLPCAFWLVQALATTGRIAEATDRLDALVQLANPLGLYAEELDPISLEHLGNYPQALTHAALVQAARRPISSSSRAVTQATPATEQVSEPSETTEPRDTSPSAAGRAEGLGLVVDAAVVHDKDRDVRTRSRARVVVLRSASTSMIVVATVPQTAYWAALSGTVSKMVSSTARWTAATCRTGPRPRRARPQARVGKRVAPESAGLSLRALRVEELERGERGECHRARDFGLAEPSACATAQAALTRPMWVNASRKFPRAHREDDHLRAGNTGNPPAAHAPARERTGEPTTPPPTLAP